MNTLSATLAQANRGWAQIVGSPMFLIMILILVMWIFMMKSKRNQDRRRQELLNQIKKGDRIQTIGGILGTVVEVRDQDDEIVVKVDESSNTKMRFIRAAIHRVIGEDKDKGQTK